MMRILVIDIGGTHIKFLAVEGDDQRELGRHFPTEALRTANPIESFARMIEDVCGELAFKPDAVVSTVPGFLNPDLDLVHYAGNVPELNGHRLASELSARLGLAVHLERDSILLLQGEWVAGAGQGASQLLGIFFGTGVGGAYLQDGVPFRGAGFSMEIGSIPFKGLGRTLDGLRPDCLETYVSGRVLAEIASRHQVPINQVFMRAADDPALRQDVDAFIRDMAMAVATAVALLSPDTTVVGGGICFMQGFSREAFERVFDEVAPVAETGGKHSLRWAELGWKAAGFGAALRAEEEHLRVTSNLVSTEGRAHSSLKG